MKHSLLFFFMILPLFAHALEVDEKLTVRILKTSESRKTIMVNRGIEDGLVEGDHARFIVTAGIVARAVCVRVSPTRSVWSVYRLVNADFIVNDSVMTLKITPPVKITKDSSQALVREDVPSQTPINPAELGIPLADGAQDLHNGQDEGADSDLMSLNDDESPKLVEKNIEVFGILNISGLTSQSKSDATEDSFTNSQAYHHIGIGGEYYPRNEREWYSRFSLIASVNLMRQNNQAYNGASSTNDVNEVSVGVNWHWNKPSLAFTFIPFIHASVNMGAVKSSFQAGSENTAGEEVSNTGATNGASVGFGYKFYTNRGFGARALVDYYFRNETYDKDELENSFTKAVAGPRLMVGLSYRF